MSRNMLTGLIVLSAMAAPLNANETMPQGWKFVALREETAPQSSVRRDGDSVGLVIAGSGDGVSDGKWVKQIPLPQGQCVGFSTRARTRGIDTMSRNVIAALVWLDEGGKEVATAEFADTTTSPDAQGWRRISEIYTVPPKAKQARLELRLRWSASGEVEFRDTSLQPAPPPTPRNVKIASIHHRPRGLKSAMENLEQFAKWIDDAGASKADIVCLPEAVTLIGRGADYLANAEPIPGPSTEFLGQVAARNKTYIVAGLLERDGKAAYNTAVLIDRQGKLLGKYRKVCLPTGEYNGGLAPGTEFPVFDTDFGRIGIMICWDVSYPEVARELAARGAEIILMPIWGGNETLCKARAIENQIPLVTSSYDLLSAIYDQAGEPIAQAKDKSSCVIYADMNLAETRNWEWTGNWRSRIWIEGPGRKDVGADARAAGAAAGNGSAD